MAEELSPESKLYVKEEIEKMRKEFKEDLEKAQSKATKTFSAVAMIVGLLASVGVYSLAKSSIKNAIENELEKTTIKKLGADANDLVFKIGSLKGRAEESAKDAEGFVADANTYVQKAQESYKKIIGYETDVEKLSELLKLKRFDQLGDSNDYAWVGDTKFVWGTEMSKPGVEWFDFKDSFDNNCFFVITTLPGYVYDMNESGFKYQRMTAIDKPGEKHQFWYMAIGH